jgi:hypothetical protein
MGDALLCRLCVQPAVIGPAARMSHVHPVPVDRDTGSPATPDYPVGDNAFTGAVTWVRLELGGDSHDHLIDAHDLLHLAMTRR